MIKITEADRKESGRQVWYCCDFEKIQKVYIQVDHDREYKDALDGFVHVRTTPERQKWGLCIGRRIDELFNTKKEASQYCKFLYLNHLRQCEKDLTYQIDEKQKVLTLLKQRIADLENSKKPFEGVGSFFNSYTFEGVDYGKFFGVTYQYFNVK